MGGDTPLDYLSVLADKCGISYDMEDEHENTLHGFPFTRELVERHMDELYKEARETRGVIMGHVLGVTVMWVGAEFPEGIKDWVIQCANKDPWMLEERTNSERGDHVQAFIETLEKYETGQSTEVEYTSLFGNLAKKIGGN